MATVNNLQDLSESAPAATYNTNVSNASTLNTVQTWNQILLASYQLIENVTNGSPRSSFISANGSSISLGFSTGTLELLNGTNSNGITTFSRLVATSLDGNLKTTVSGSLNFEQTSGLFFGTYNSWTYEENLKTSRPFGNTFLGTVVESVTGSLSGVIGERAGYSTDSQGNKTEISWKILDGNVGTDLVNGSAIISPTAKVSSYGYVTKSPSGQIIESWTITDPWYHSANGPKVSNGLFVDMLSQDDVILMSGTGDGLATAGQGGNDFIKGNTGNNGFNNRVDSQNLDFRGLGNDTFDGGAGYDTVYVGSNKKFTSFLLNSFDPLNRSIGFRDTSLTDNVGNDLYKNIEEIQFADATFKWLYYSPNLAGTVGNEFIVDDSTANNISANSGNDTVSSSGGSDILDGGPGTDRALLWGNLRQFSIKTYLPSELSLQSTAGELITLRNFEAFDFKDQAGLTALQLSTVFRSATALVDKDGHYLFTANSTEAQIMQQYGWSAATNLRGFESADNSSGTALHKFYYPPTNSFYYATDDQAKPVKSSFAGWDYQGVSDLKVYTNYQYASGSAPKSSIPIFQMWVTGMGHVYTTDPKLVDSLMGQDINTDLLTANNVATSKGTYNGVVFWGDPEGANSSVGAAQFSTTSTDFRDVSALQDKDGHYLFTANATEAQIMQQYGWSVATGLKAFESADNANGITLHKFYYQPTNSFYYATDDQAKAVKAAFTGWDYQGATDLKVYTNAQYSSGSTPKGSVPIYQMWVNGKGHVYTSDTALVDRLMGQDINTDILTANNVVTAVGTYNGVVFWGDPIG